MATVAPILKTLGDRSVGKSSLLVSHHYKRFPHGGAPNVLDSVCEGKGKALREFERRLLREEVRFAFTEKFQSTPNIPDCLSVALLS